MNWKSGVCAAVLGAGLLLAGASSAQARDCYHQIRREEEKLARDIRKHGFYSRQAEHRRIQLSRLRDRCGFGRFDGRRLDRRYDRFDRPWGRGLSGAIIRGQIRRDLRQHRHDRCCGHLRDYRYDRRRRW